MAGESAVAVGSADERLAYRGVFQRLFIRPEIGSIVGAAAIWAFFWAVATEFGKAGGTASVLDVAATLGIMAVAVSLLMIGGEFDLSSGAATGTLGIITILLVKDIGELGGAGLSLFIAIPASLLVALGLGWFNGTLVERTSLPSFIVTLATFFMLRGFKLGFSKLIIDNITVGRVDEGHGYDFWQPIFDYTWARNEHQFEARDALYTIGVLGGIAVLVLAVHELNYRRKASMNPAGLGALALGLAGTVAGIIVMHSTDGVGSNTVAGLILAVSIFVALVGLAVWRYERQSPGGLELHRDLLVLVGGGVVLVLLGAFLARILDVESQESVLDLVGIFQWPLVVLAAVLAGVQTRRRLGTEATSTIFGAAQTGTTVVAIAVVSGFAAYAVMFMSTEQGLRAILFGVLIVAGFLFLAVAASRAAPRSPLTRGAILGVFAVAGLGLAFFIRAESTAPKFRTEVFTIVLVGSLMVAVWAVISTLFVTRTSTDLGADNLGGRLTTFGLAAIGVGVVARLLFTTDAEIVAGIPPANFRISVLWFIGFTVFATLVLGRTKFGSWIFAVGGNKEAARQIGVPAARTKTQLFMIVSVAAWLVGLLLAFRLNTIQSGTGNGLEFEYIIAAVVGGTLLTGGYGSALGAGIGAVIMAMSKQGIPAARWNSDWRFAFLGVILLAAVIANNFIRKKAEGAR